MLKGWMHDIALAVQAKSGATPAVFVWVAVLTIALLTAFVFLCVAAFMWLSLQFGGVVAGLIMAGVFVLIAAIAAIICSLARRHARERAILERAARAHAPSWLLDPEDSRYCIAGRPLGRLAAHRTGCVVRFHSGAMGPRIPRARRRQPAVLILFISAEMRRRNAPGPRGRGGCRLSSARRDHRRKEKPVRRVSKP